MSSYQPGKRITRLTSKNQANGNIADKIAEEMTELEIKRKLLVAGIKKLENQFENDEIFPNWSRGDLNERMKRLDALGMGLMENNMEMMCKNVLSTENENENENLDELVLKLKAKASDRIDTIVNASKPNDMQTGQGHSIRVIQTDAAGNVPNTWGTFAGDYAKWHSFRDRWMPIHENKDIKAITKFHALKAACTGVAAGALGEWDMTDDNYYQAFKRLSSIFEDDYMQAQAYMQKLIRLPKLKSNSSKAIRKMIDTVQQHIAGTSRYVQVDSNHPYAVFSVIDKLDLATFRAWEQHRPKLASVEVTQSDAEQANADNPEANANASQNAQKAKEHIPTWKELEKFLEREVSIRVHEEKHDESENQSTHQPSRQDNQNNFGKKGKKAYDFVKKERSFPSYVECGACGKNHSTNQCETFRDSNLLGRKQLVLDKDLCDRCLRKSHDGECKNKRCNLECPRCKPLSKFHNSLLCPNADRKAVMLARGNGNNDRKRKHSNGKHQNDAKRRRTNNSTQSVVNKIGEWSLKPRSNALARVSDKMQVNYEGESNYTVLLATLNVTMQTHNNTAPNCRALSDTGAAINCVSRQFVEENALTTTKCQKPILGVTGPEILKRKVKAFIHPWFDDKITVQAEFFVLNNLDGYYPFCRILASKHEMKHLVLADENFDVPAPINALLGAEIYAKIIGNDIYQHKDGAIIQSTTFGHIVLGKFKAKKESNLPILSITQDYDNEKELNCIAKALNKFWDIENINKDELLSNHNEEEKAVENLFVDTHFRENTGRFVVSIPIKSDRILGESRSIALKQFLQLERRLEKNPEIRAKYIEFMRNYQSLGYMQPANKHYDPQNSYWLPHHAVEKKFRVVVNASQKTTSGESLNSVQMCGPKLQHDLALQLMRFRKHKVAAQIDIMQMFNKVGLNPKQWDLQRIFWRESPKHELKEYVITVVMFGLKSSPFNAVRVLIQCAKNYEKQFPEAAKVIELCFYMDDGIFGAHSIEELKILCKEIEFILNSSNFTLKNWSSNSKEVEKYMNGNASENDTIVLGENDETKVLGIKWNKRTDEEAIFVKQLNVQAKITKRSILKETATLYDPNGYIAPFIVKAKILMQSIWRLKDIDWDDEVPESIGKEWLELYTSLPLLGQFKLKRWLNTQADSKVQIHAFCDASEKAYGTAIYVRVVDEKGKISCTLLSAKSRVAPLKTQSIPRLELLAAVMLCEQLEAIVNAMQFENLHVTLYSDSSCVLHWIKKQTADLKAFVANRIAIIQEKSKNFVWKHVVSADNPADLVSRGMKAEDLLASKMWLEGPKWLMQPESTWPKTKMTVSSEASTEMVKECKTKSEFVEACVLKVSHANDSEIYMKYDKWNKVVNITAYVMRYLNNRDKRKKRISGRYLLAEERNNAVEFWVRHEQKMHFRKEIECAKAKDKMPPKSKIAGLRPMLDDKGMLRVGGRIDKALMPYSKRHQYIVPHKSRLSYLLLKHAHEATLHGGVQAMTYFLRKAFWIPKLRQEARRYIGTCIHCVKHAQATTKQIMSELPEIRVRPALTFQNVGVDMAGPYNVRISDKFNVSTRGRKLPEMKGWIAVFVCLVTRAVHLEPTDGLSTDDFLLAYQNFVGRRGNPEYIYSDNGTNFVGTDRELAHAYKTWQSDDIQCYAQNNGTKWRFITPSAPHEGGIWEAAVKSMKHHLKRVMGVQKYSLQRLQALTTSIEACLNSRPLCALSDDAEDTEALSPAHFTIGRSLRLPLPEHRNAPIPKSLKKYYQEMQMQIQSFWKQWHDEYLQALTQLPKWKEAQDNMQVGQLVIIKNEDVPPTYWPMGRVTHTQAGSDGKVRSVTLKTQAGMLERSVRKLCILPTDIELQFWDNSAGKATE